MKQLFQIPKEEIVQRLKSADRETVLYKILPHFFMELMKTYFRVQVEGAEHLPKRGKGLIICNHSGVSGFDAMVLHHEICRATGRYPRVLTHHLWFLTKTTAIPASRLGFIEATLNNGIHSLTKNQLVVIFPEGEQGNFKPSSEAYELQEFKRGFVRMALAAEAPIIPAIIIGAEETHVNLRKLSLSKWLRGLVLPLPLNLVPLPSKWKIVFMEPIHLPYGKEALKDRDKVRDLAIEFQEQMQERIQRELSRRDGVFF